MNKKSFNDGVRDDVLAKIIDDTLNFKKTAKNRNIKISLFKIIPAVAAIALVIGLINILPAFVNNADDINPANAITSDNIIYTHEVDQSDLFLPNTIEKSFFETKILTVITDKKALNKIRAYYSLNDSVYMLGANTSKREKEQLLEYLREYTDLTYDDMMQMHADNNIPLPKNIDPAYAHVRFGDNENILLLDIEWHTYETYMEEEVEGYKKWWSEYMESNFYLEMSEEEKEKFVDSWDEHLNLYEREANEIKDKKRYAPRLINGKKTPYAFHINNVITDNNCNSYLEVVNISQYLDENGYYKFNVYPYNVFANYFDEDEGEYRVYGEKADDGVSTYTPQVFSKREYDDLRNNEILPIFDDQLARGVISQEFYDNSLIVKFKDPADYYIDMWF